MKILFLDLASNSQAPYEGACIACVSDAKTESIRFTDHRLADDKLMPELESVLQEAGWEDKDLTHIASITGPGGFTSLRVAVTLANTYGDQLNIPMAGIRLDELYAARVNRTEDTRTKDGQLETRVLCSANFIWLHSTKKTQLFIRGFGDYASLWPEPILISIEELAVQLPEGASLIGEILPEHREAIAAKNPTYPVLTSIADVLPTFLSAQTFTQTPLTPWYGRGW